MNNEQINLTLQELVKTIQSPPTDWWMIGVTTFSALASLTVTILVFRLSRRQTKMQAQTQVMEVYLLAREILTSMCTIEYTMLWCCMRESAYRDVNKQYIDICDRLKYIDGKANIILPANIYERFNNLSILYQHTFLAINMYLDLEKDKPKINGDTFWKITEDIQNSEKNLRVLFEDTYKENTHLLTLVQQLKLSYLECRNLVNEIKNI